MDGEEQHDGAGNHEHDSPHRGRDRAKPVTGAAAPTSPPEAKLVQVKGSGLSGPFIRRPVMTMLLTLSVIVAGLATYGKLAVNDLPAVDYPVIQVTCSYPGANPTTMANNIATPLEKQFLQIPGLDIITSLPGVSQVNIYGVQSAIRIKADPAGLASRGLTMDDLASAIKAGTVYSGAGQFDGAHRTFVLLPNGQIDQAEGYRNLIVARNKDSSPVYLRDVAEVRQSVQDERLSRTFWMRGFNPPGSVVVLAVSRQAGANAVEDANAVEALFPEIRASLPGSITLVPVFDRSQSIVNSVADVKFTLMIAFILV